MDLSNYWPVAFFQRVSNGITRIGRIVAIVIAVVLWINKIIVSCLESLFESFLQLLNTLDISALKGGVGGSGAVSFAAIEYIGYINAFLPVSEFVGLMVLYLTAWSIVIALRWGKSLIPTFSN